MIFAMFSICTISASAKDISKSFSQGSHTFNKKWEVHAAWIYEASPGVSVQVGEYKYGFNTLFFNEDYTHLHAFDKKTKLMLKILMEPQQIMLKLGIGQKLKLGTQETQFNTK